MNSRHRRLLLVVIAGLFWLAGNSGPSAAEERPASFDCGKDRTPLASTVCSSREAIAAERRTASAYLAVFFSLDENGRTRFRNEHIRWANELTVHCAATSNPLQKMFAAQTAPSRECITHSYARRAELYRKRLHDLALEEANLSLNELKQIQRRLVESKFLSRSIDGTFGAETRIAIRKYQASIGHAQANFLTRDERTMLLAPTSKIAQTSVPSQQPRLAPGPASGSAPSQDVATTELPIANSDPDHESSLPNIDVAPPAAEQSVAAGVGELRQSKQPAIAEQLDEVTEKSARNPAPYYFDLHAMLVSSTGLAGVGCAVAMVLFFVGRLRRRRALVGEPASVAAVVPAALVDSPKSSQIPPTSNQPIMTTPVGNGQESCCQEVAAGGDVNEDAIATIIADLLRKDNAGQRADAPSEHSAS